MCGIYGAISNKKSYDKVFSGLKLLQYRGYDSCGIAYFENGKFKLNKAVGTLDNMKPINTNASIAFGHTRWATNGEVNISNTHPHISHDKNFTLVHNGIISNADRIKHELEKNKIPFYSNTDTEVIANVLSNLSGDADDRVKKLFNVLEGSFSLIIGYTDGSIYLVKHFSPLNIVISGDEIYISSDVSSLPKGGLYSLVDGDVIKIKGKEIISLTENKIEFTPHENSIKNLSLNGYEHFMLKEINEIPKSIYNTYKYLENLKMSSILKKYKKLTFIGCGTAYHSCLVGEYLFKRLKKFDCESVLASNYVVDTKIAHNHLHIIVSQSGETADCIKVADNIKRFKGKILIITNEETSTITKFADYLITTKAGKELAVASTKTYCSQILVFMMLAKRLTDKHFKIDIKRLCYMLKEFIDNIDLTDIVEKLKDCKYMILIGKDIDYITLLEASLKIREIDYIYTIPMYAGELKHGTLSLIDSSTNILSLNSSKDITKLNNAINEISSRGGSVIDMSSYLKSLKANEDFTPIFSIIPFQLLSYNIALARGYNPDMPRNLAKSVTVE